MNRVVFFGDLHCGSRRGLLPESQWTVNTPDSAKWLYEKWMTFSNSFDEIDLAVITGDLVDGTQRHSEGVGLVTTSLGEQTSLAVECCEAILSRAKKIIRVEGTAYPESFHGPLSAFDEHYGVKMPKDMSQRIVRDIDLGNGAVLNVKHQPEGEGALYRGTTMDREVLWATMTECIHGIPKATHIVRGHLHSFNYFGGFNKRITLCPCFCLQQPYATMKKYYRWTPNIGGLVMEPDPRGESGWLTYEKIYPLPTFKGDTYEDI